MGWGPWGRVGALFGRYKAGELWCIEVALRLDLAPYLRRAVLLSWAAILDVVLPTRL